MSEVAPRAGIQSRRRKAASYLGSRHPVRGRRSRQAGLECNLDRGLLSAARWRKEGSCASNTNAEVLQDTRDRSLRASIALRAPLGLDRRKRCSNRRQTISRTFAEPWIPIANFRGIDRADVDVRAEVSTAWVLSKLSIVIAARATCGQQQHQTESRYRKPLHCTRLLARAKFRILFDHTLCVDTRVSLRLR